MRLSVGDAKLRNWYSDKYVVANIQKNILFILSIFLSVGILVSVLLVKYVYENRSVEPYLVEIDRKSGIATIVESETVRQFTASEVIRESFVVKYIKLREGFRASTVDEDKDLIRAMSTVDTYNYYTKNQGRYGVGDIKDSERGAAVGVTIRSILFTSPKTVEAKITRYVVIDGNIIRKRYFKVRIVFDFFDLDLSIDDRYLNPLGFQVVGYDSTEEKVSGDYDPDKESQNLNNKDAKQQ